MNADYQERIEKVITYIKENSEQKLTLDQLAAVSNFSKYHFARIFTAIVGVTPVAFVNRVRVQKAASQLVETDQAILAIANQCGFESLSTFHALFKKYYAKTPSEVRKNARKNSNFSSFLSNQQEELAPLADYNRKRKNPLLERAWQNMITIKELPEHEVAYVRHVGSYLDTHVAWDKLGRWASRQELTPRNQQFIGISLDDGNLVEEYACRYDACVTLPQGFEKRGHQKDVAFQTLAGGLYARYPYYDTVEKFVLAYQSVFRLWLPNSEYDADDRPCLEFCMNDPARDPEGKCKVDLYIPIKKK
ncbi:AraC family transcriptional regulator [Brevibacillus ruminantium]|uniref:AraC family transcriptional regulator n=1 Tax=Brevibacillus ruminantium TaxID=2950604 RepID=A0ABY4WKI6_9BACL|nr:AraC family transcriptional regulator [Brevibacillus ruminantium]USG66572.1 AraC family transcriptional regulator [Brevibacillus ruminantium]